MFEIDDASSGTILNLKEYENLAEVLKVGQNFYPYMKLDEDRKMKEVYLVFKF